jgi:hypothetical protein
MPPREHIDNSSNLWNLKSSEESCLCGPGAAFAARPTHEINKTGVPTMKITLALLAAAGLTLSSGVALAQTSGPLGPEDTFNGVDTDDNGKISWPEFMLVYPEVTQSKFDIADTDKDTFLSLDEFDNLQLATGSIDTGASVDGAIAPSLDSLAAEPDVE